tara:strand:- start:525 stop:791 length:267 start_codon:yes stop_codon:yes gene_type:complete
MQESKKNQFLIGKIVSSKMEKTIKVRVTRELAHPVYKKRIKKFKNYLAHYETGEFNLGDLVQIISSKPISKNKKWRFDKVIQKALILE